MRGEVTRNRNVQGGQPCLRDTRMPTEAVWEYHEGGFSLAEIREQYPSLTIAQIHTAIVYEQQWWRRLERWLRDARYRWCDCD